MRILFSAHVGSGYDLVETERFGVPFDRGVEIVYGDGNVVELAFDLFGRHDWK
jgi:hypothetical protein